MTIRRGEPTDDDIAALAILLGDSSDDDDDDDDDPIAGIPAPDKTRTMDTRIPPIVAHVRQAITTTFKGPTDRSDPRVIARCEAGRLVHVWDDSLDERQNHTAAALALADRFGWLDRDDLVCGGTHDGYVFVMVPRKHVVSR